MRNRKRRKKRWQQDVTLSFGVIASIESHNNADNKLECCLHSVFKVFSVLSMRLESDVDHLFFISNNSRTKHKTVKAISKHHLMILFIFIKIIMIIITAIMIVLTVTTFSFQSSKNIGVSLSFCIFCLYIINSTYSLQINSCYKHFENLEDSFSIFVCVELFGVAPVMH